MPEFEEAKPQSNPEHSYAPSSSNLQEKGGRRRSGGFKSEVKTSEAKIGEVNPAEVLEAAKQTSAPSSNKTTEIKKACSTKKPKSSSEKCCSDKTKKSQSSTPQPSKATLESIKGVEAKIAKRSAEDKKARPAGSNRKSGKQKDSAYKKSKSSNESGLFAAIGRFLGTLFAGDSKNGSQSKTSKRGNPRNRDSQKSNEPPKNVSRAKQKNRRSNQRRNRKDTPRHNGKPINK